jgi:TorA maturation chaperone TorD
MAEAMNDPAFLSSVLGSLPGVDPSDPQLKSLLAGLAKPPAKDPKDKEEPKK